MKYLGGNGTVLAIVMIGMLLVGVGSAYPFGAFDGMNDPITVTVPAK